MSRLWRREEDAEEVIQSGRVALEELHRAANRLSTFVAELDALVAEERASREMKRKPDA